MTTEFVNKCAFFITVENKIGIYDENDIKLPFRSIDEEDNDDSL